MSKTEYRYSAAATCAIGVGIVCWSLSYPYYDGRAPGPGFFPFWLGVLLAVAGIGIFLRGWLGPRSAEPATDIRAAEEPEGQFEARKVVLSILSIALFLVLWPHAGTIPAASLLLFLLFGIFGLGGSHLLRAGGAVAAAVAVYVLFDVMLGLHLPTTPWPFG